MNEELEALESNNTWEITDLPHGKHAIGCNWLYTTKYNPKTLKIERHKSRLVGLGNRQKEGIDYKETFAPVAKMTTVRSLLAIAALNGWNVQQVDVKIAFLHGDLQELVYMNLPQGYLGKGYRFGKKFDGKDVSNELGKGCKLIKCVYGLKPTPRQWYAKLSSALMKEGYNQSKTDYSLFTRENEKGFIAILVYVDDLIITGSSMDMISQAKEYLKGHFNMKHMGELRYFLGIEADRSDAGIFMSQRKYIMDILHEYHMEGCKPLKLPMDAHVKLIHTSGTPLPNPEKYQRLIGKLIYLTITRPDISFIVHVLSQFMHAPSSAHYQAAIRVLRYLAGS